MADLSIIFVNYKSSALVAESIQSLLQYNSAIRIEIIIADNDSGDDSKERIQSSFPQTRWIQMPYNAGFARANNAAMLTATADTVLLLNPDTISIDDSITRCYERLRSSDYVAAGVQQLNINHEPQISGNYFMKGGLNHLLPLPYWGALLRRIALTMQTRLPHVKEAASVEEVDWISGAFMMVKKEAVEKAGLMDEDFFLYAEEVEWCSRLRKHGKLCIYGDLKIIHLEGSTINKETNTTDTGYYNLYDKKGLQLMVSNHLRVRKQFGVGWFLFLLLNYTWGVFCFWICSTIHRLVQLKNPFADWNKAGRFAANVFKLWTLTPRIISNKPYFYKMLK